MKKDFFIYFGDIVDAITHIEEYTANATQEVLENDDYMQDAVIRRFEIIGEAASRISSSFKKNNPSVHWRLMKDMRNKLIHEYFGISLVTVYTTSKLHLPILKEQLEKIV